MERVKRNRAEKIKFFLLIVGFILIAMLSQVGSAKAEEGTSLRIITMESPSGSIEKFKSAGQDLIENISTAAFSDMGIILKEKNHLCSAAKPTEWRNLKRLETELELSYMIASLKDSLLPRKLTEEQKKILAKTPLCQPYLADLKIISNLVKGYKLVGIDHL